MIWYGMIWYNMIWYFLLLVIFLSSFPFISLIVCSIISLFFNLISPSTSLHLFFLSISLLFIFSINFTPQNPINYYRRVSILVADALPLFYDVMGSGFVRAKVSVYILPFSDLYQFYLFLLYYFSQNLILLVLYCTP